MKEKLQIMLLSGIMLSIDSDYLIFRDDIYNKIENSSKTFCFGDYVIPKEQILYIRFVPKEKEEITRTSDGDIFLN